MPTSTAEQTRKSKLTRPTRRPTASLSSSRVRRPSKARTWIDYFPKQSQPLFWGLPAESDTASQLFERLTKKPARRSGRRTPTRAVRLPTAESFQEWLLAVDGRQMDDRFALETLAWTHWLAEAGEHRSGLAAELPELIAAYSRSDVSAHSHLGQLVMLVEIPLSLAAIAPSLAPPQMLAAASQRLAKSILSCLSQSGWTNASDWRNAASLVASWTRIGYLCRGLGHDEYSVEQRQLLNAGLRQLWRACQSDVMAELFLRPASINELLRASIELLADDETERVLLAARSTRSITRSSSAKTRKQARKTPARSHVDTSYSLLAEFNEPAQFSVMRDRWGSSAIQLVAQYMKQDLHLDLRVGSSPLLRGSWRQRLWLDEVEVGVESEWEHVCWHNDEEGDYLELELSLTGCRLQRQLIVSRRDRFAFFADSIFCADVCALRHQSQWTLAKGTRYVEQVETREGHIRGRNGVMATIVAAAIPEWRADTRPGILRSDSTSIVLEQESIGSRLYAPLFVDLDPTRRKQPITWRRLTVAEQLQAVPSDVAVAYRIQVGDRHWLFYRDFGPRGNRTFLGKNACCDFFLGRFLPDKRDYETIVEID